MGFFVTDGQWKIGRIIAFLVFLGLLTWLIIYLFTPLSEDTWCNPRRTHLDVAATICGYIFWALLFIGGAYFLFIRRDPTGQSQFGRATSRLGLKRNLHRPFGYSKASRRLRRGGPPVA